MNETRCLPLSRRTSRGLLTLWGGLLMLGVVAAWRESPAAAENILFMPSAGQMRIGEQKLNFSLVDSSQAGQGDLALYEAYYGLSNSLEISLLKINQRGAERENAFNISYFVTPETRDSWATTVGVSNLGGDRYLGDDDPSYYIAFYRTRGESRGPQGRRAPAFRYHFGYGTNVHDGFFGGVQVATSASMWLGAFNYTGQPTYLADYTLLQRQGARLSLRAGYLGGARWIGLSYASGGGTSR